MKSDPIGLALSVVNRIAGNPMLDQLRLRSTVEKAAYEGTRAGFRTLTVASREFKRVSDWLPKKRLPSKSAPDLFDLNLDEEQQLIVDSLQRLARDVLRPAASEADTDAQLPESVFEQASELGLCLYAIPEAFGGVAEVQSPVTSVLIAEYLAWGDFSLAQALLAPFSVAQAITQWGTGEQQSRYLPAFCEEKPPIASIAIDEPDALFDPYNLKTKAEKTDKGYRLKGVKSGVVMGSESDMVLVAADLDGKPRLFIVEAGTEGVSVQPDPAMGLHSAQLTRMTFENTLVKEDALLGDDDFNYEAFLDRGALMRCGLAIGAAQAVLDYVIPYCNEREAFGEPISHRQSVAFMISNIAIELEGMRMLTWRAASRAENGMSFHRESVLARMLCAEKAMEIGTNGVQLLGGHGFTREHPVERWYRDLRSVATQFGGTQA